MKNIFTPQKPQNVFVLQVDQKEPTTAHGVVRQDIIALRRDRRASLQPAAAEKGGRSQKVSTDTQRLQNATVPAGPTVPLTLHVPVIVKDRVQQIAVEEGLKTPGGKPLSLSEVGTKYLGRGMQEHMDMQYGALLEPVLKSIIHKEMQEIKQQFRWLLVRVAFDGNQTRSLVTNIFTRQPGITKEVRERILVETAKAARKNIFGKSPQITELVNEFDKHISAMKNEKSA